jgi:hypothetical protein
VYAGARNFNFVLPQTKSGICRVTKASRDCIVAAHASVLFLSCSPTRVPNVNAADVLFMNNLAMAGRISDNNELGRHQQLEKRN